MIPYSLTSYLKENGFSEFEGNSQQIPEQVKDLIALTSKPNIKVMEIGFNAGHSAEVFLSNNDSLSLVSFDIGLHSYIPISKKYIDSTYPNRHTLILGDSGQTVREYILKNRKKKELFDVIFIDGGHDFYVAYFDLKNCFELAHKDTIVIMDDTIFRPDWKCEWNYGPTVSWQEFIKKNKIVELGRKEYSPGRGMVWGKYNK